MLKTRPIPNAIVAIVLLVGLVSSFGCVRRTIKITTEPSDALVYLNDQEIGHSPATTDFLWYGDYDVIIRKEGYETLKTHWNIKPPWYQVMPLDFFSEVLWPGYIQDFHERQFVLAEKVLPTPEELVERADEARARAHDRRK